MRLLLCTMALVATMTAAPSVHADLWNDTPMRAADIYFNSVVAQEDLDISQTMFARQSCAPKTGGAARATCSMLILPVAQVTVAGASLDEPPTSMTVIFVATDNVLAVVQTNAVLAIGASPDVDKSERSKLLNALGRVMDTNDEETVTIGQTDFTISVIPMLGVVFVMEPTSG